MIRVLKVVPDFIRKVVWFVAVARFKFFECYDVWIVMDLSV